jgi:hypothetical protein
MSTTIMLGTGDNEKQYAIQRFRGFKAILAVAAVTRIGREVPDIMADAAKAYQGRNTVTVTEGMSKLPRWSGFSTENFDAAEAVSGRREIEIPSPASQNETILQSLPELLDKARVEVIRLLAILIIPNEELKTADKADKVEEALDAYGEILLYDAELDQLMELALVASDVLTEQLADRKDRLGKLIGPLTRRFLPTTPASPSTPQDSTSATEMTETTENPPMSPTSTDNVPSSSIDSPAVIIGAETKSSTVSPGVS